MFVVLRRKETKIKEKKKENQKTEIVRGNTTKNDP